MGGDSATALLQQGADRGLVLERIQRAPELAREGLYTHGLAD